MAYQLMEPLTTNDREEALDYKIKVDASLPSKSQSKMFVCEIFGQTLFCVCMNQNQAKISIFDYYFDRDYDLFEIESRRVKNEGRQFIMKEYIEEKQVQVRKDILEYLKKNPKLAKELLS